MHLYLNDAMPHLRPDPISDTYGLYAAIAGVSHKQSKSSKILDSKADPQNE